MNLFSFLNPTSLSVQTPPELQPYGWTTTDLWCAPAGTAIYALLTHAQPFWADLHTLIYELLSGSQAQAQGKPVEPVDPETARAICAVLLSGLFLGKTAKNFGLLPNPTAKAPKIGTLGFSSSRNSSFADFANRRRHHPQSKRRPSERRRSFG